MAHDDDSDLSDELKTRIESTFARLGTITHYELLGVERSADKKTIKRAYYALTAELHPDRHFGKKLGRYRPMLDAIVARIHAAHDVLTDAEERAVYDASLDGPKVAAPERLHSGVRPAVTVDLETRKQMLARRLVGGMRIPSTRGMQAVRPPTPPVDPNKKKT